MEIDPKAFLFLSCVNGSMAAYFAKSRQKNPYLWFGIGFLFGLIGIFYFFYLTSRKQQKTATLVEPARKVAVQPLPPGANKMWYYLDSENTQFGPMSYQALANAQKEGKITPSTYVWNEDLIEWKKLEEVITF